MAHLKFIEDENATIHKFGFDGFFHLTPSRLAQDPNISNSALGLMTRMLSFPADWKINAKHLAAIYKGTRSGNGLKAVWADLRELRDLGYVHFSKTKNGAGKWECRYDIYAIPREEYKKLVPHTQNGSTEKGCTIQDIDVQREQQQGASAPAAVSSKSSKPMKAKELPPTKIKPPLKMYECLKEVDIPDMHKYRMTKKYSEESVKKAVEHVTNPDFVVDTTLVRALYYFCSHEPSKRENKASREATHKEYAMKYEYARSGNDRISYDSDGVLIYSDTSPYFFALKYSEKEFMSKFKNELKNRDFKILE